MPIPHICHKWELVSERRSATEGEFTQHLRCTVCGSEKTQTAIPPVDCHEPTVGHSYRAVGLELTGVNRYTRTRKCKRCGDVEVQTLNERGEVVWS
jgi:rRNA maturation protein Nop10